MILKLGQEDGNIIELDTERRYRYKRTFSLDGKTKEEEFILELKLQVYDDGEGYGTQRHYGWAFYIVTIIKEHYTHRVGNQIGTAPDLCACVRWL